MEITAFATFSMFMFPLRLRLVSSADARIVQHHIQGVMIFNSACWGGAYVAAKASIEALQNANTGNAVNAGAVVGFLRFALALFPLLPWLHTSTSRESARMSLIVGFLWGLAYACTFVSYTLGTTGAKAAFITSLQSLVVAGCSTFFEHQGANSLLFQKSENKTMFLLSFMFYSSAAWLETF